MRICFIIFITMGILLGTENYEQEIPCLFTPTPLTNIGETEETRFEDERLESDEAIPILVPCSMGIEKVIKEINTHPPLIDNQRVLFPERPLNKDWPPKKVVYFQELSNTTILNGDSTLPISIIPSENDSLFAPNVRITTTMGTIYDIDFVGSNIAVVIKSGGIYYLYLSTNNGSTWTGRAGWPVDGWVDVAVSPTRVRVAYDNGVTNNDTLWLDKFDWSGNYISSIGFRVTDGEIGEASVCSWNQTPSYIFVAWQWWRADADIYVTRIKEKEPSDSLLDGRWDAIKVWGATDPNNYSWPEICYEPTNFYLLHLVCDKNDTIICYARSTDGGANWLKTSWGRDDRCPCIEAANNYVLITWTDIGGIDSCAQFRLSTDGGSTWGNIYYFENYPQYPHASVGVQQGIVRPGVACWTRDGYFRIFRWVGSDPYSGQWWRISNTRGAPLYDYAEIESRGSSWGKAVWRGTDGSYFCYSDSMVFISEEEPSTFLSNFPLSDVFPNPFHKQTVIRYYLPKESHVTLKILNALGKIVTILVDSKQKPGYYNVFWNTKGLSKSTLPAGIYFYRLETDEFTVARKIVKME